MIMIEIFPFTLYVLHIITLLLFVLFITRFFFGLFFFVGVGVVIGSFSSCFTCLEENVL